jgi:rare lipoprotein A (peptidoglycan hydrolase)
LTLHRMMVVASCCLFALTVTARAEAAAPAKRTTVVHGVEKTKLKKRIRPRTPAHNGKARPRHARTALAAAAVQPNKSKGARESGIASWYGRQQDGQRSANGEIFDKFELTAAHRTLPLESEVRVTNTDNGRSVTVRVTDRGPTSKGRIIDLSQGAAEELGMKQAGVAHVSIETLPTIVKTAP